MSATIYKDVNYQGIFSLISAGFYSGRQLTGCHNRSADCEEMDNAINSIRVGQNTIVAVADGLATTAKSGGCRVFIGPMDIPNLVTVGMANKISSILVVPFKTYNYEQTPTCGITLYDTYGGRGRQIKLSQGDYPITRLKSEEVKFPGQNIVSIHVAPHTIAILYNGSNFEPTQDATICIGDIMVNDVQSLGMDGRINSIQVLCGDPYGVPPAPQSATSLAKQYSTHPQGIPVPLFDDARFDRTDANIIESAPLLAYRPSDDDVNVIDTVDNSNSKSISNTSRIITVLCFIILILLAPLLSSLTHKRLLSTVAPSEINTVSGVTSTNTIT
jgi:hypothetical protein